jgi:cation-transporting P-type ATPase D
VEIPPARQFTALPGRGVRAEVRGRTVAVLAPDEQHRPPQVVDMQAAGATVVVVLVNGRASGLLGLNDLIRTDAVESVERLTRMTETSPVLLTGDNASTAAHVAQRVGIHEVRADLLPDEKRSVVEGFEQAGRRTLVVGDGVNDAPAMAAAHASMAMGRTGADLSIDTADAVTVRDELTVIPTVLALARRARRIVIANLVIAGSAIVALVTWDLVGELPLPLGVAGHEGSTILVALNGLRLLTDRAWRRAGGR